MFDRHLLSYIFTT